MFRTLHSKLLFFFLALSLGGIILVSIAIHFGVQETFYDYLMSKRNEQISQIAGELEREYETDGEITGETTEMILHQLGLQEQLYFQFFSEDGELTLDSSEMMGGMGRRMMGGSMGPINLDSEFFDKTTTKIRVGGTVVGELTAFYPSTFVQSDNEFLAQFNKYLIFAVIIMTFAAFILSFIFSKRLTKGLKQIGEAMRALKKHQLDVVIKTGDQVKEIEDLAVGFNELAESLKKGEELRKQFTSDLAHELRTPLATLRSQLESFQDGVFEPTPERLDQSHHELMRLVGLVNEMEKLHSAENPQLHLNMETLSSSLILQSLFDRFQPLFKEKDIAFSVSAEKNKSFSFAADRDRFIQVVTNLLNNALKYTYSGGKVQLEVSQDEKETHFIVADNGQGMSETERNYIYDRFYRGEKSRNRKTGGLGIGMSIVKALVDAQRGRIQVESEVDKGTKVTVSFQNKL